MYERYGLRVPSLICVEPEDVEQLFDLIKRVPREDVYATFVGHVLEGRDVYYLHDGEVWFFDAIEKFLLSYFDMYSTCPNEDAEFQYEHEHIDGVFYSWHTRQKNDRYLVILFSEGVEDLEDGVDPLSIKWPEPSGGVIVDTKLGGVHLVDFNIIDMMLPHVFFARDRAYRPKEGFAAFKRYTSIVKEFIRENPLPPPDYVGPSLRYG